ncbi:SDR family NAD(P)-dependent oxidoreductase [Halobacillus sp. A5]|uniref:SDR family NAD(P)-dependent oxidoreductase n=1 Tax=Halobacillus sp. A5 TaxID=2880263 RepID=UPI0020A643FB|nr:SDR family oxidoreductase [Halobacillus sp. A5]
MKPTALITGASGGIGYELAHLFAKAGYDLIVTARSEIKLQQLKTELNNYHVTVIAEDLSHPEGAHNLYEKVKKQGKTIEVLVNNAGFGLNGAFEDLPLIEQKKMLQVNIHALTELTHYFINDMKTSPFSTVPRGVLNVASIAAFQPGPRMAAYYASKAYVLSFTEALREELSGTGLTISTLCPGATDTNFFNNAKAEHTKLVTRTMSPKEVADQGFLGFIKGKRVIIPGWLNQSLALSSKFVPRATAAKLAHYMDT